MEDEEAHQELRGRSRVSLSVYKQRAYSLRYAFSNGTSMISLIIRKCPLYKPTSIQQLTIFIAPKDQISRVGKMLADEYGTASNIKSRVNRLSVLSAITSTQQRLKLYNRGKSRDYGCMEAEFQCA